MADAAGGSGAVESLARAAAGEEPPCAPTGELLAAEEEPALARALRPSLAAKGPSATPSLLSAAALRPLRAPSAHPAGGAQRAPSAVAAAMEASTPGPKKAAGPPAENVEFNRATTISGAQPAQEP